MCKILIVYYMICFLLFERFYKFRAIDVLKKEYIHSWNRFANVEPI